MGIDWKPENLDVLIDYCETIIENAEASMKTGVYPPDDQKTIDENEACITLLKDMKNTNSWVYRYSHINTK